MEDEQGNGTLSEGGPVRSAGSAVPACGAGGMERAGWGRAGWAGGTRGAEATCWAPTIPTGGLRKEGRSWGRGVLVSLQGTSQEGKGWHGCCRTGSGLVT